MNGKWVHCWAAWPSACAVVLIGTGRAAACSVCFGDPGSPMAKGAVAGVLVMVGVVGAVLLAVAGTSLFWVQRGRRLSRLNQASQPEGPDSPRGDS